MVISTGRLVLYTDAIEDIYLISSQLHTDYKIKEQGGDEHGISTFYNIYGRMDMDDRSSIQE